MAISISPFLSILSSSASTSYYPSRLLSSYTRRSTPSAVSCGVGIGIEMRGYDFKTKFLSSVSGVDCERFVCRAAEYRFPDPIPEFADAETEKFREHLMNKLTKKVERYGDSAEEVVGVCTEIFSTFLHSEYGGPGTLMVVPFCDMADTINEKGLPGGPQAARAAIKWAQEHVDKDWNKWTGNNK